MSPAACDWRRYARGPELDSGMRLNGATWSATDLAASATGSTSGLNSVTDSQACLCPSEHDLDRPITVQLPGQRTVPERERQLW